MTDVTAVNAVATDPTQTTTEIVAKRGRGRPKLAVTAYDRARDAMVATGSADTATLLAAVTALNIKKSSAAVYLHRARKEGVIPAAPAAT